MRTQTALPAPEPAGAVLPEQSRELFVQLAALGIPWVRILEEEIEAERALRQKFTLLEDDWPLWAAFLSLPLSPLSSFRVRDRIHALSCEARSLQCPSASRQLRAPPASLPLRLAAGGARLAAADALWLTVLPRIGRSWAEPERKAAWIEGAAEAMIDANPRAVVPVAYCAQFLERIRKRHPGIERVVQRALSARRLRPFGRMEPVNRDSYLLPEFLGMNLHLWGTPDEKRRALEWIERAARLEDCPTLVIDFYAALRARQGRELDGWEMLLHRAATTSRKEWREYFLDDADRERRRVLQQWAERAGRDLGRVPSRPAEVAAGAPAGDRESLRADADLFGRLFEGVAVRTEARWVEIPALTDRLRKAAGEQARLLAREFEARTGRPPASLHDLLEGRERLPETPIPGTRWEYDAASGTLREVDDLLDPRLLPRPAPAPRGERSR